MPQMMTRRREADEKSSALAYWGTGFGGIILMIGLYFLAGLRF
ncbi:hypothetical protein [Roseococcus sp. YIM B11640]